MLSTGDIFHFGFVFQCMVDIEIKQFTSTFNQPDWLFEIIQYPGGATLENWISFNFCTLENKYLCLQSFTFHHNSNSRTLHDY